MKFLLYILFMCIISLPTFAESKAENLNLYTVNGVQVFVLDPQYKNKLDSFFKELKSQNINTVFFRVFHNSKDRAHLGVDLSCESGVYFKTSFACTVNDLLPEIVASAHVNGIKVFAWMATRSLSFLKTSNNISKSLTPDGIRDGYGANIFKLSVRNTIIGLFEDLAKTNIDGILIQDDFIIKYTEGADEYASQLFYSKTGLNVDQSAFFNNIKTYKGKKIFSGFTSEFYIWANWKNKELINLFTEIKNRVKSIDPTISMAVNIYYETPIDEKLGLTWYSQNINSFLDAGVDYLAIMGYAEQIAKEKELTSYEASQYIGEIVAKSIKQIDDPRRIIIKLQSKSFINKSMINIHEFQQVCRQIKLNQASIKNNSIGIIVLPINKISDIYKCSN